MCWRKVLLFTSTHAKDYPYTLGTASIQQGVSAPISVQYISMRFGKPVCTPSHLQVPPALPLKQRFLFPILSREIVYMSFPILSRESMHIPRSYPFKGDCVYIPFPILSSEIMYIYIPFPILSRKTECCPFPILSRESVYIPFQSFWFQGRVSVALQCFMFVHSKVTVHTHTHTHKSRRRRKKREKIIYW